MNTTPSFTSKRRLLVSVSWLNIAIQLATPLAMSFTPAIAARTNTPTFLRADPSTQALATRPYVLGQHETTGSVAKRYNMTPDALRKLNQFRTFARGWESLRTGDELDVPVAPLPPVLWEDKGNRKDKKEGAHDGGAHKIAGLASQAGGLLVSRDRSEAAASMARGMATGAVGGEVQQWLSQFGTARVQLDADKKLSLKNSSLDLLVPLHEQKDRLVFAQGSVHRTDERTQANLGMGYRWFTPTWMLGANTFLDHDLSRSHTRMGVGVEYWRDFLKLGANSYHRLSGWKDSPDVTDYEERPANGWDVRAQAWLPMLPQLGGKLTYEQYYGNEVGLFGKEARQRNPHAITAGINYTPVPLLTFNAEHRQGQSGKNDARVGLEMRYQLGVPWRQQVDPSSVAAMRSLMGSRHDLVDRNNNIVLEYRKKEVIRLHTAEAVTGFAGERKSLGVSVNSKYGLERIDWSAPALLAAGGKIVHDATQGYGVVLPPYKPAAGSVNSYRVSGVAIDRKGNASNQSETQVTVLAPVVSDTLSTFLPASSALLADGKGTQELTLTLKDGQGQVVDVAESDIVVGAGEKTRLPAGASISAPKKSAPGIYKVIVTAGTRGEIVTLTPVVNGVTLSAARVNINDMTPAAEQSSFSASPTTLPADNQASTTLTLTLKNAAGNALSGLTPRLSLALKAGEDASRAAEAVTLSALKESGQGGVYTATLKGTAAGQYTVIPAYNGSALGNLSASVTLMAGAAVRATSTIHVDKASYASGDDIKVTVILKDSRGNPVVGQAAVLSSAVTAEHATLRGEWSGNATGEYTATYTAKEVGVDLKAGLLLNGWQSAQTAPYAITAGAVTSATLTVDKASYVAGSPIRLTATLKDAQGNAVPAQAGALKEAVTAANAALSGNWTETDTTGTYSATYTANTAGTGLKAALKLGGVSAQSAAYAITAGAVTSATLTVDKASYVAGSPIRLTATLKDAQGNAVPAQAGALKEAVTAANAALSGNWTETDTTGTYSATYTANTAGTGLKAALKLGGVSAQSAAYAITAGAAVTTKSTIVVKGDSFVSGSDMTVVVTLKDAQGNLVSGHEELLDNGVAVPNATLKTNTHWTESSTEVGVYNATYVAVTASINQTATLRLGSSSVPSGTYAITPGAPAQEASAISVDGARYLSGGVLAVMVTLKDAAGNSISGEESKLATVVKVPNTEPKEAWVDKGDGVYGATYTATVVGDNLKATLALNGWSGPRESGAYRIVLDGIAGVQVNGYRFGADAGFPTTGFAGAKFTFELKEGKAADYTWSSSAPWVSVNDNGEVSFTGQGNGQRVTLTGTAKSGGGAITYSFQLKRWFTNKGDQAMTWSKANMTCRLPKASEVANSRTLEILGGGTPILTGPTRVVGNLWGEWGGKALSELYPPDRNNSIARWLGDATIAGLTGRTYGEGPFIIDPFFGSIGASNGGYSTAAPMCVEDF